MWTNYFSHVFLSPFQSECIVFGWLNLKLIIILFCEEKIGEVEFLIKSNTLLEEGRNKELKQSIKKFIALTEINTDYILHISLIFV